MKLLSGECHKTPLVNFGNDLVLSGNKPLPEAELILTQIYVAIWCH